MKSNHKRILTVLLLILPGMGCGETVSTANNSRPDNSVTSGGTEEAEGTTDEDEHSEDGKDAERDLIEDEASDSDVDSDTDAVTSADGDIESDADTEGDLSSDDEEESSDNEESDNDEETDEDDDEEESSDEETSDDNEASDDDEETVDEEDGTEDSASDEDTEEEVCAQFSTVIEARPVKLMILQDISRSMNDNSKWTQAQAALDTLLTQYENDIAFGFDAFPNFETCGVSDPLLMDTALSTAADIVALFPSVVLTLGTPLYKAMLNFTDVAYAPIFSEPDMDRYLLIVSDGGDTCYTHEEMNTGGGGRDGTTTSTAATPEQLGALTEELFLDFDIKTLVIGFGLGTGQNEDGDSLNAIAVAGGMTDTYIEVQNEAELTEALTEIGATVISCTYEIGEQDSEVVDLNLVNVYFNETEAIPRDDGCASGQGWSWTDDTRTSLEFCEASCERLQSGEATDISIKIMCSEDELILL